MVIINNMELAILLIKKISIHISMDNILMLIYFRLTKR